MPLIHTRVLKPELFNATTVAAIQYDIETGRVRRSTLRPWMDLSDAIRGVWIDKAQELLDRLVAYGILGVE